MIFSTALRSALRLVLSTLLLLTAGQGDSAAWIGREVSVRLIDGSTITGKIDARSDQHELCIRRGTSRARITRVIPWETVEAIMLPGRAAPKCVAVETVRDQIVRQRPSEGKVASGPQGAARVIRSPLANSLPSPQPHIEDRPPSAEPPSESAGEFRPSRVRWISVSAEPGNWDADTSDDGLVLRIRPVTDQGTAVAARGLVQVALLAYRTELLGGARRPVTIARWSVPVRSGRFDGCEYVFRLPYQRIFPEIDTRWAPYGLVHVRLSIPGEGVFEANDPLVRLRAASPLRDRMELTTGRRFAPLEHVRSAPR